MRFFSSPPSKPGARPQRGRVWLVTGLALVSLGGGVLTGCGGGGSKANPVVGLSSSDQLQAVSGVQAGQAQLNALLSADTPPSQADLNAAAQTFAAAYAQDPQNNEAAMGLALSSVAAAAQKVSDAADSVDVVALNPSGRGASQKPAASAARALAHLVSPWKMGKIDGKSVGRLAAMSAQLPLLLAQARRSGRAQAEEALVQSLLELKATLARAIPLIKPGANQADFAFALIDYQTGTDAARIMDAADATVFLASVQMGHGALNAALAYDLNAGAFDFNEKIGDRFIQKQAGDTVFPDEYLPPAPFLTLTPTGKADFAQAKKDLENGADSAGTALHRLQARPANGTLHLLDAADANLLTAADYAEARSAVAAFELALSVPIQVPGSDGLVLNLGAWFANPPASLRPFLPTYLVKEDSGFTYLDSDASSFADLSFGGLISGINPDDLTLRFSGDQTVGELLTFAGEADFTGTDTGPNTGMNTD